MMKTKIFRLLVFSFLLLSICEFASAQSSEITVYAGGFRGESFVSHPAVLFPEVDAVFNDNFTAGVRYAYFFNSHIAFEGGIGFTPASILAKTSFNNGDAQGRTIIDVDTWVTHANLTAHLLRGSVIPFVTGGVGAVHFQFKTSRFGFLTPSETNFAWNAGGGIKVPVRKNTALRFEGREYWMKSDFAEQKTTGFTEITGGVSILFNF